MPSKSKSPRSKRGGRPTLHRDLTISWSYASVRNYYKRLGKYYTKYYWARTPLEEVDPTKFGGFTDREQVRYDLALRKLAIKRRQLNIEYR
jgi:hypothetical protein